MLKHIARHNEKKIVVVFREVPDQEHMALVVYTDALPSQLHDDLMKAVESTVGQGEHTFADALHRTVLTDGRNALSALHADSYLKKVPTNQIIMMPTTTSTVRLDELNKIVNTINSGDAAKQKLADLDSQRGLKTFDTPVNAAVLSDESIATDLEKQASKMKVEADALLAESKRLSKEAADLKKTLKKVANAAA